MKYLTVLAGLVATIVAKEIPKDAARAAELYDSGVMHSRIMERKAASLAREERMSVLNTAATNGSYYQELPFALCRNGTAKPFNPNPVPRPGDLIFRCKNVINLHHFLSHTDLGSSFGKGSSSWGWVSDDGREFAIIAQGDGAAFAEITTAGKLRYLGRLPQTPGVAPSRFREIRRYKEYIIVGSEEPGHGIQIFDLKKLLTLNYRNGPVTFDPVKDLTAFWNDKAYLPLGRAHNVLANEETGMAYVVGAQPRNESCYAGLIMLDINDPANPTPRGCAHDDGYVHDAQCLIYRGPHTKYAGREICYGYNEDTLTIYDVSDKAFPVTVSITSYEGASYTHQGAVLDPMNQTYLIMDDEGDEQFRQGLAADGRPVTYIWDITNLEAPKQTGYYKGPRIATDHNQYIFGKYSYQSNYGAGISILDVSSIPNDPSGKGVTEVGWFDAYPEDDNERGGGITEFVGSWSSYAGYPSGFILINTIERGAFVVKAQNLP